MNKTAVLAFSRPEYALYLYVPGNNDFKDNGQENDIKQLQFLLTNGIEVINFDLLAEYKKYSSSGLSEKDKTIIICLDHKLALKLLANIIAGPKNINIYFVMHEIDSKKMFCCFNIRNAIFYNINCGNVDGSDPICYFKIQSPENKIYITYTYCLENIICKL